MKLRDNQKGMSLVEIIIVIAMIGILAGTSISMFSYIKLGNTKKVTQTVRTEIEKQQAKTMSKTGVPYLYVYKRSDGYYMKVLMDVNISNHEDTNFAQLDDTGTRLSGTGVDILKVDSLGAQSTVTETDFIRIVYKKDGVFDNDTNVSQIIVDGTGTYTITLVKATGKLIVE